MTDTALATSNNGPGAIERVIALGDLGKLSPDERSRYYFELCGSLKLNPLTRPFEYLSLQGKLVLYARKDATDQLRALHRISLEIVSRETVSDLYVVTAKARTVDGRTDEEIGAVSIKGLAGDALANAFMKASTKAKRRVTLSICGLGLLDESELETIREARIVVDERTTFGSRQIEDEPVRTVATAGSAARGEVDIVIGQSEFDERMAERRAQATTTEPYVPGTVAPIEAVAEHIRETAQPRMVESEEEPRHPEYRRAKAAVVYARGMGLEPPDVPKHFSVNDWTQLANHWTGEAQAARSKKPAR